MKILIINPNSDLEMTKDIQKTADAFVDSDVEVVCKHTAGAPKFIETYEKANQIEVSAQTKKYREELLQLEKELQNAIDKEDASSYKEITNKIRIIAGNMNLSNVYFGGFKSIIYPSDNFDDYKAHVFDVVEGTYKNGSIEYAIDSVGIITEIKIREG